MCVCVCVCVCAVLLLLIMHVCVRGHAYVLAKSDLELGKSRLFLCIVPKENAAEISCCGPVVIMYCMQCCPYVRSKQ